MGSNAQNCMLSMLEKWKLAFNDKKLYIYILFRCTFLENFQVSSPRKS